MTLERLFFCNSICPLVSSIVRKRMTQNWLRPHSFCNRCIDQPTCPLFIGIILPRTQIFPSSWLASKRRSSHACPHVKGWPFQKVHSRICLCILIHPIIFSSWNGQQSTPEKPLRSQMWYCPIQNENVEASHSRIDLSSPESITKNVLLCCHFSPYVLYFSLFLMQP